MRAGAIVLPFAPPVGVCPECRRPMSVHRVAGEWIGCRRDPVIGQDQEVAARRARLALLQPRVLKVHPFGIDVEGPE